MVGDGKKEFGLNHNLIQIAFKDHANDLVCYLVTIHHTPACCLQTLCAVFFL